MSSTFQILNNRPIDKWKVVELREELKKRRLTTRGLKKDLVKRLDAAIRAEREKAAEEADTGSNDDNSEPVVEKGTEKTTPTIAEKVKEVAGRGGLKLKDDTADCVAASGRKLDEKDEKNGSVSSNSVLVTEKAGLKGSIIDDNVKISLGVVKPERVEPYSSNGSGQGVAEEKDILVEDEPVIQTTVVKTVLPEVSLIGQHLQSSKLEGNVNSDMKMECQDPIPQVENEGPKALLENEDGMHGSSALNNQVSEISPISGFQVKPDSVSTDLMSITEKIELKDNIVDDNVMSKMVEPYSSSGSGEGVVEEMDMLVKDEPVIQATEVKTMIFEEPLIGQHSQSSKQEENVNSNMQMENQDRKLEAESDDPIVQLENEGHMDDVHERFKDVVDHGSSELEFKDALSDFETSSDHGVVEETDMLVDDKPVLTKVPLVEEHLQSLKTKENEKINTQIECQDGKLHRVTEAPLVEEYLESLKQEEIVNSNKQMECQDAKSKMENEDDSIAQLKNEDDKDDMHETVVVDPGGSELEFKDAISDLETSSDHGVVEETDMLVDDKLVLTKVLMVGEHLQSSETKENENINTQVECQDEKPQMVIEAPLVKEYLDSLKQEEIVNSNKEMECQDAKYKVENEDDSIAQPENEDNKDDMHETTIVDHCCIELEKMKNQDRKLEVESDDPMVQLENEDHMDDVHEQFKDVVDHGSNELEFKDAISDCEAASGHDVVEETNMLGEDMPVVIEVSLVGEHLQNSNPEENVNSNTQIECQDENPQVVIEVPLIKEHLESMKREKIVNSNKQMESQDAKSKVENEDDSIAQPENEDNKDDMHETDKDVVDHGGSEIEKESDLKFKDAISDYEVAASHGVVEETEMVLKDKPALTDVPPIGEHLQSSKPEQNVNSNTQMECQDGNPQVVTEVPLVEKHLEILKREENVNSDKQMEYQDAKSQIENQDDLMDQLENKNYKDDMHEKTKYVVDHGSSEIGKESELEFKDAISDCEAASGHGVVEETDMLGEYKPVLTEVPLVGEHLQSSKSEENVISYTQMECRDRNHQVMTEVPLIEEHLERSQREENVNSNDQTDCQHAKSLLKNEGLKVEVETEDPKAHLESGDGMHDSSSLNNHVPEVNPVSGFQVKPDSIFNDSMPIIEKTDLKDNINDENVKLRQYVFKLEMVEPCSSTNVVPSNGESHPMEDDEQPLMNKASVDEIDENSDTTADMSNKDKSEEVGYSENFNLDRSSSDDSIEEDLPETKQTDSNCTTDDSMEEDLPETKQIDSNCTTDKIEEDSMENKALIIEELESTVVGAGDGSSTEQKDIIVENKSHSSGKRKLQDAEAIEDNRPPKRQKCNPDNLQVPEQQTTYLTPINTPKDTMQFGASQSNFSSSDSTDGEDTRKEQDVPPSQKPPTTSLRVDNFLHPFTLKAVQQLLGKTGIIKTHCYVTYSSVEEAIETRNAFYNLQWPPNGGRLLVAEFVDPHGVETHTSQHQPSAHQQVSPEKRLHVPPLSPPSDEPDSPMVTLGDLFWKTKATPKIFYFPLSEEQAAAKQTTRERNKNW